MLCLFFQVTDLCELKRHIYGDTIDRSTIQQFVDMLFPSCDCEKLYEQHKLSSTNQMAVPCNPEDVEIFQQKLDDSDLELFFSEQIENEMTKFDSLTRGTNEELENLEQAKTYYLKDLECTAESNDEHGLGITMRNLARFYQKTQDNSLLTEVAAMINISEAEVREAFEEFKS